MARILLGVSGGIAAYKSLELARLATLAGHGVRVLMTESATRFVGAASFEGIIGAPVLISEFERDPMRGAFPGDPQPEHDPIGHLELAANCDAFLVAPASANTIAKLAAGMADSMLTTSFLACAAPRLVAPAMNDRMYADAATQANLATLRERGVEVIEPDEGRLASRGEFGRGRLPDPARLLARVEAALPTGEPSLGRPAGPGHRRRHPRADRPGPLHRQPLQRPHGHRPRRRRGPARRRRDPDRRQRIPARARRRPPHRRRDRRPAGRGRPRGVPRQPRPPDGGRPGRLPGKRRRPTGKLKRQDSLDLHLEPTEDILASLAAARTTDQTIVGFAAEHGEEANRPSPRQARPQGRRPDRPKRRLRLQRSASRATNNAVTLIDETTETVVAQAPKDVIADAILERVDQLRSRTRSCAPTVSEPQGRE